MSVAPPDDRSRSRLAGGLIALVIMLVPALLAASFGGVVAGKLLVPGYRDSPDIVYLALGGVATLVSLLFATIAGTIVRALKLSWTLRWRVIYLLGTVVPFVAGVATTISLS
jgi:hypothetical protein